MRIDFTANREQRQTLSELAATLSKHDLRLAIDTVVDDTLDIIAQADDFALNFEPLDEAAHDAEAATSGEVALAWNLAHLVLHITASLEEGAAFSSILARGVTIGGRLRYEPDWRTYTTKAQIIARLEECRRMCQAYLETWPEAPHLDVFRETSESLRNAVGPLNAPGGFLLYLRHWDGHFEQMRDVLRQAQAASDGAPASAGPATSG
jgi:hypothetical protein